MAGECLSDAQAVAKKRGLPTTPQEDGLGVFDAAEGRNINGNHAAVRNPDGTITDRIIFANLRNGKGNTGLLPEGFPKALELLEEFDTFDPRTYSQLIDWLEKVRPIPKS